MIVRVQDLVGGLNLIRLDLDTVVRQRQEPVVSVREIEAGRTFPKVMVDGRIDLSGCEAVNDRVDPLDMGQATREFSEFTLRGVYVEELASIRAVFDFRDLALSAGELDVVANLEVSHSDTEASTISISSSVKP